MVTAVIDQPGINVLSEIVNKFDKASTELKYTLLSRFATCSPVNTKVLKQYHDLLLFIKAYPDNKEILHRASMELLRIASVVKSTYPNSLQMQRSLSGTGIAGSSIICQYSYTIVQWLLRVQSSNVIFYSAEADNETSKAVLQLLFPRIEYYYCTQKEFTATKRILLLCGQSSTLENLMQSFENIPEMPMREVLFDQLKIYISWQLNDQLFNHTLLQGNWLAPYYQRKPFERYIPKYAHSKPKFRKIKLTKNKQQKIIDLSRASLALYCRETEPITYVHASSLQLFDCGNAVTIALFGIDPNRMLAIETYIGYMLFKNNVPVAYGGVWIFGDRCKIGLNIYPPFRKGDSYTLFDKIISLYKQEFHLQRFVVKPYQFGKGNPEGLASGAFWFYYKMGFRPADKIVAVAAANDYNNKIRSSISRLKYFTTSNLELCFTPMLEGDMDPEIISKKITEMIKVKFSGNRKAALQSAGNQFGSFLPNENKTSVRFEHLSLLLAFIGNCNTWSRNEKMQLEKILHSATADIKYIHSVRACKRLHQELFSLLKK